MMELQLAFLWLRIFGHECPTLMRKTKIQIYEMDDLGDDVLLYYKITYFKKGALDVLHLNGSLF